VRIKIKLKSKIKSKNETLPGCGIGAPGVGGESGPDSLRLPMCRNPLTVVTVLVLVCGLLLSGQAAERFSLDGGGWELRTAGESGWRPVSVPHCWPVDAGYLQYVGQGFYRRTFLVPLDLRDKVVRLRFKAVFYKAVVRLNGVEVGRHEGGTRHLNSTSRNRCIRALTNSK
jgi:hypothetical protein